MLLFAKFKNKFGRWAEPLKQFENLRCFWTLLHKFFKLCEKLNLYMQIPIQL